MVVSEWCRDPVVWWSWSGAETLWSGAEALWSGAEALWCGGFEEVQKPCSVLVSEWFKRSPKLSVMSGVEEKVDVFKRFCLPLSAN